MEHVVINILIKKTHTHTHSLSRARAHTRTHTYTCMHACMLSLSLSLSLCLFPVQYPRLFSIPPLPYGLLHHSVEVLVLQMTSQTHYGSKLAASLSAATYSNSRFSCVMFWSAFVTMDSKQSQSSFELMWKE